MSKRPAREGTSPLEKEDSPRPSQKPRVQMEPDEEGVVQIQLDGNGQTKEPGAPNGKSSWILLLSIV